MDITFDNRKIDLSNHMEALFPKYLNVQGHNISLFKKTFTKNLDDIVWNSMDCESKDQARHIKYLDNETKVYLLLSIFNKTKEQVCECYECISNEADLDCFNFYNRHFSNDWPSNKMKYLMHLIVCNAKNDTAQRFSNAELYANIPRAPGEFVVFMIG